MKPRIAALAIFTLTLTLFQGTSRAGTPASAASGMWAYPGSVPAATYTNFPSYSYWTAAYYGYPPRIYVGYRGDEFPYYGRPYGSPSDPWSWPAMAGYSSGIPTRYYPVLR